MTRFRLAHPSLVIVISVLAVGALCTAPARADALIVLNKSEATASIIAPESGVVVATVPVGDGPHEAAASPDGRLVVACNYGQGAPGNTLTVIDMRTKQPVRTIDLGEYTRPHGVEFLADGERVVVTSESTRSIVVVNIKTGQVERAIDTNASGSHMVALASDGSRAFVANIGSGSMSVVDLRKGELVRVVETGAGAEGIAVSPDGDEAWVTNRAADTVSVINARSLEILATIDVSLTPEEKEAGLGMATRDGGRLAFPIRVKLTPDGETALVSCAGAGDVRLFNVRTRAEIARIRMDAPAMDDEGRLFGAEFGESPVPVGILVEPSGRYAYIASTRADIVTVIDLENRRIARRLKAGREPDGMAWSTWDD